MRYAIAFIVIATLLLFAPLVLAQPAMPAEPQGPPPAVDEEADVTALEEGEAAPFAGVLVTEERFEAIAEMKLDLDFAQGQVVNRDREIVDLTARLEAALARGDTRSGATAEPGWWERHDGTISFVLGAAVAGLAVWGAVEVLGAAAASP